MLLVCLFGIMPLQAQDSYSSGTIINELQSNDDPGSEGVVRVKSDPAITALLGLPSGSSGSFSGDKDYMKKTGYRVQVFSGNNPRLSKSEAFSKKKMIEEAFPDTPAYVDYDSPNWRLRVGDFRTKEEAVVFMQELKKAFPDMGKEMYTVVDKIKIPIEKQN